MVAHTKRAGRVGAGDSSEQARRGNGAGCDSRRWPGRSQTMIVVAEVRSSFRASTPDKHLCEEFTVLRGCRGWCPALPLLFASLIGKKNLTGLIFYVLRDPRQGESPRKFIVI